MPRKRKIRKRKTSTLNLRPTVAPKVLSASARPEPADGAVAISVHDEITRDYSVDPPSE